MYTYVGDSFPTDTTGDGQTDSGGTWYVAGAGYETGPTDDCVGSLSGGAPYAWSGLLCSGTYTLDMSDSYGDGWNGNMFTSGDVSVTLESGIEGSASFSLDTSACKE